MNHWKLGLAALVSVVALVACPSPTPPSPPPPPGPPAPPPPPATITVSGKVVDNCGNPVPAATAILLQGTKPTVTTGADGTFSFSNVTTPYDLAVNSTLIGLNFVLVYKNLTRPSPQVTALFGGVIPAKSGTVGGTLSNGTGTAFFPTPIFRKTSVTFGATDTSRGLGSTLMTTNPYGLNVDWCSGNSSTGTVHALQWNFNSTTDLPSGVNPYTGAGQIANVTVANGGSTTTGTSFALDALSAGLISGTVNVPDGTYTISEERFGLHYADNAITELADQTASFGGNTFSIRTPIITNTKFSVQASATGPGGRRSVAQKVNLGANDVGVTLALPLAPSLGVPNNAATGVNLATQSFGWSSFSGGMHAVILATGVKRIVIFTTSASVVVPSTTDLGLGTFPALTPFTWNVLGFTAASTDALTDPAAVGGLFGVITPTNSDFVQGTSEIRNFTLP
jgi:hypothetical protein